MILFDTLNIFQPAYPVDMCFFFVVPAAKSASERKIFLWTGKSTTDPSEQGGTPKIRQHRCGIYRYIYSNIKIYTTFLKPKANSCRFPKYTVLAVYIYICLTCIYIESLYFFSVWFLCISFEDNDFSIANILRQLWGRIISCQGRIYVASIRPIETWLF